MCNKKDEVRVEKGGRLDGRKGGESPIKGGWGCICSTYSQQILIYSRAIKPVLNLSTAPPYHYIHRACVKGASDRALGKLHV